MARNWVRELFGSLTKQEKRVKRKSVSLHAAARKHGKHKVLHLDCRQRTSILVWNRVMLTERGAASDRELVLLSPEALPRWHPTTSGDLLRHRPHYVFRVLGNPTAVLMNWELCWRPVKSCRHTGQLGSRYRVTPYRRIPEIDKENNDAAATTFEMAMRIQRKETDTETETARRHPELMASSAALKDVVGWVPHPGSWRQSASCPLACLVAVQACNLVLHCREMVSEWDVTFVGGRSHSWPSQLWCYWVRRWLDKSTIWRCFHFWFEPVPLALWWIRPVTSQFGCRWAPQLRTNRDHVTPAGNNRNK